ncbi:MAG: hypothetical protein H8E66_04615 [Planctomycetes bacterium]|nr:hypothetical protein [Planctomycetota bacterium]
MGVALIVAGCVLAVVVLVITLIRWSIRMAKERTAAMSDFAAGLELEFFESGHEELLSRLATFQLFNSGHSRRMKNVIIGKTELASIAIFDYRYTTGGGKNQSTHNQTVVTMESESLALPNFTMRPEHLFDRVGSALGFQDIDFDDHPQFSQSFVLKGKDEAAIREFFDPQILDFFADRAGICFEGTAGRFIYFRGGTTQSTDDLRKYLEEGYSVYQAFTERLSRG